MSEAQYTLADLRIIKEALDQHAIVSIADASGNITYVNDKFCQISNYSRDELIGQNHRLLKSGTHDAAFYAAMWETIHRTGTWQGELWDRRKNGEIYPTWLTISTVKGEDGGVTHYVGSHIDITERRAAEEKIQHLAFYDPLTRLPNRRLLMDIVDGLIKAVRVKLLPRLEDVRRVIQNSFDHTEDVPAEHMRHFLDSLSTLRLRYGDNEIREQIERERHLADEWISKNPSEESERPQDL